LAKSTNVTIAYSGSSKWQIDDVRSANKHLSVKLEPSKSPGKIEYLLQVRLKDDAPAGELIDEIVLVTNEPKHNFVTLPVRATIVPPVAATPKIELGTIKSGSKVTNKIVLKAKQPFKIEKIDCEDGRFKFTVPTEEKAVHLLNFEFNSDTTIGAFQQTVVVSTSLNDKAETSITGNISE
jgi:hypothetical protein